MTNKSTKSSELYEPTIPRGETETVETLDRIGRTAVKVAASTVLASSLVSALGEPPHVEQMTLPEPVPIVRQYQVIDEDVVADQDEDADATESRWRRLLRLLKYLLVALLLAGTVLLGALKVCAGIVGATLAPDDECQEESARQPQAEDERGVALEG